MNTDLTCLLIDDDEDDRQIFSFALEDLKVPVRCVEAVDGVDALAKLSDPAFVPDYIFLDLNMPRMDGKECILEIKKITRLINVPVVVYSTSSIIKDKVDAFRLGAADFFTKPPSIRELTSALHKIFTAAEMLEPRPIRIPISYSHAISPYA